MAPVVQRIMALVVQRLDNAIRMFRYPAEIKPCYKLDSDLSGG